MRLIPLSIFVMPLIVASSALAQVPVPKPVETALIVPGSLRIAGLGDVEAVLSEADVDRYFGIFALQADGRWREADALARRLQDRRLMGHVLAQKYLHPTKYRSRFKELRAWMDEYADHPQARRIHHLAVLRQPKGARGPRPPVVHAPTTPPDDANMASEARPRHSRADSREGRRLQARIRARVGRGWPTGARELLERPGAAALLTREQISQAWRDIARGYYRAGKDTEAMVATASAGANALSHAPLAHWWGGLAAWRFGDVDAAQRHFVALAGADNVSDWVKSAAAYWSARALLVAGRPADVNPMLERGARYPRTFYGLLSRRALGEPLPFDWREPALSAPAFREIAQTAYGGRAIALLQVGRLRDAELELAALAAARPALRADVVALASHANLAALTYRLAGFADASTRQAALYPLPNWQPVDGFAVDQALIYAIVRQESAFNVRAQSRAGARGLMQLMPRTASFIARQRSLRGRQKNRLFDPELNLSLGQRYIGHLQADAAIANDLFRLTAAYNAGPGNLRSWEREIRYGDDPLLFIESLPARETRLFIERILTNLWIYRDRLGQPSPSLDDVVSGRWPGYRQLDADAETISFDGKD